MRSLYRCVVNFLSQGRRNVCRLDGRGLVPITFLAVTYKPISIRADYAQYKGLHPLIFLTFRCPCRRACGFQKKVGTSAYGGQNMSPPGWNRFKVAAKTLWGPVLVSPCPEAHLNTVFLIDTVSLINNHSR